MSNPLYDAYIKTVTPSKLSGGRQRIFPTRHPNVKNADGSESNVVMMGHGTETGREYVIPTMVEGRRLEPREAVKVARAQGIHNYPSFKTPQEGEAWAQANHGNIDEEGFLRKPKGPSLVDTVMNRQTRKPFSYR
jgi:hypothetical protein